MAKHPTDEKITLYVAEINQSSLLVMRGSITTSLTFL